MSDVRSMLWLERIDANAVAACCYFQETCKGTIYGAGTFVLLEQSNRNWQWRVQVDEKLKDELRRGIHCDGFRRANRYGMPVRGYVRDLNRA